VTNYVRLLKEQGIIRDAVFSLQLNGDDTSSITLGKMGDNYLKSGQDAGELATGAGLGNKWGFTVSEFKLGDTEISSSIIPDQRVNVA